MQGPNDAEVLSRSEGRFPAASLGPVRRVLPGRIVVVAERSERGTRPSGLRPRTKQQGDEPRRAAIDPRILPAAQGAPVLEGLSSMHGHVPQRNPADGPSKLTADRPAELTVRPKFRAIEFCLATEALPQRRIRFGNVVKPIVRSSEATCGRDFLRRRRISADEPPMLSRSTPNALSGASAPAERQRQGHSGAGAPEWRIFSLFTATFQGLSAFSPKR